MISAYSLAAPRSTAGAGLTYPAPSSAWVDVRYGYAVAEPRPEAWHPTLRDPPGDEFARCGLRERSLYCRSAS